LSCSRDCILGRHEFQDPTNIGSNVHPVWSFSFLFLSFTLLDLTLISPPQFSWSHLY
jgi:hypothetical protein